MVIILVIGVFVALIYYNNKQIDKTISYPEEGYLLATSYMLDDNSKLITIDNNSKVLDSVNIKAKDLSFIAYNDKNIVVSGQRSNDNLILNEQGNIDKIHFWKKENKTGTTTVKTKDDKIYALMNVGYVEGIYQNCLIIQDRKGTILDEVYLQISGSNMLIMNNYVIITGSEANSENGTWHGKIIIYDIQKKEIINDYINSAYSEFSDICMCENDFIVIAKKLITNSDSIIRSTFKLEDIELLYQGQMLAGLYIRNEKAFVVDNSKLVCFDLYEPDKLIIDVNLI